MSLKYYFKNLNKLHVNKYKYDISDQMHMVDAHWACLNKSLNREKNVTYID